MGTADGPLCRTCARFGQRKDDRLAAVSEFGNCELLPVWHYRSPSHPCHFDPVCWAPRAPKKEASCSASPA